MKIVIAFPPFYLESMYNLPPLGMLNLASSLKNSGHSVKLIDFVLEIRQGSLIPGKQIYEACASKILDISPDVIGFSAQCTTYPAVIQISRILKKKSKNLKIVIGGHNASFLDSETLENFPYIDSIVRGEGEITFNELINSYDSGGNGENISGVTFRKGAEIIRNEDRKMIRNLDDLPLSDYSFLPSLEEYRDACGLPRSIAILEVGRGCPHNCIYCSESVLWRRKCRTFSVSRLIREMINLSRNFDAECFLLAYDQFTANRSFVESFCNQVIEHGLNHLPWYCISRLDSVDASLLGLMRKAGCESMCYGIDSGSEKTLAFIRKNIDRGILYKRVIETAEQGIVPTLSYVIGFPEEQKEDINETLELALQAGVVGNNNPLIQIPTVLPGTDLHRMYSNKIIRRVDTYFALGLEFDHGRRLSSDEELINSDPAIFSSFYNLPCPGFSLENLDLISSYFPLMVRFFPKSFLLLSRECHEPVGDLFLDWLKWVNQCLGRKSYTATPQEYYLYFHDFFRHTLSRKGEVSIPHLNDILRYEKTALEAAKFSGDKHVICNHINNLEALKPQKPRKILIERFDFDLSIIIFEMKEGIYKNSYPEKETFLLFRQDNDILEVLEINRFTHDFLELCNGGRPLGLICDDLFDKHGKGEAKEAFLNSCVEAFKELGEMGFVEIPE